MSEHKGTLGGQKTSKEPNVYNSERTKENKLNIIYAYYNLGEWR